VKKAVTTEQAPKAIKISISIDDAGNVKASYPNQNRFTMKVGQEFVLSFSEPNLLSSNGKGEVLVNGKKFKFVSQSANSIRIRAIAKGDYDFGDPGYNNGYDISINSFAGSWEKGLKYYVRVE